MRAHVRVPDLLKRRSEKTMLRANLQGSLRSVPCVEFITRIPVIDCDDVTACELARDIVDPIERSEIHFGLIRRGMNGQSLQMISELWIAYRLMEECKLVAIQGDKLLQPISRSSFGLPRHDQMHRHGIRSEERRVGKER